MGISRCLEGAWNLLRGLDQVDNFVQIEGGIRLNPITDSRKSEAPGKYQMNLELAFGGKWLYDENSGVLCSGFTLYT